MVLPSASLCNTCGCGCATCVNAGPSSSSTLPASSPKPSPVVTPPPKRQEITTNKGTASKLKRCKSEVKAAKTEPGSRSKSSAATPEQKGKRPSVPAAKPKATAAKAKASKKEAKTEPHSKTKTESGALAQANHDNLLNRKGTHEVEKEAGEVNEKSKGRKAGKDELKDTAGKGGKESKKVGDGDTDGAKKTKRAKDTGTKASGKDEDKKEGDDKEDGGVDLGETESESESDVEKRTILQQKRAAHARYMRFSRSLTSIFVAKMHMQFAVVSNSMTVNSWIDLCNFLGYRLCTTVVVKLPRHENSPCHQGGRCQSISLSLASSVSFMDHVQYCNSVCLDSG